MKTYRLIDNLDANQNNLSLEKVDRYLGFNWADDTIGAAAPDSIFTSQLAIKQMIVKDFDLNDSKEDTEHSDEDDGISPVHHIKRRHIPRQLQPLPIKSVSHLTVPLQTDRWRIGGKKSRLIRDSFLFFGFEGTLLLTIIVID